MGGSLLDFSCPRPPDLFGSPDPDMHFVHYDDTKLAIKTAKVLGARIALALVWKASILSLNCREGMTEKVLIYWNRTGCQGAIVRWDKLNL